MNIVGLLNGHRSLVVINYMKGGLLEIWKFHTLALRPSSLSCTSFISYGRKYFGRYETGGPEFGKVMRK